MSKFQIILTAIFGVFILVGVAIFALGGIGGSGEKVTLSVWGTMGKADFDNFVRESTLADSPTITFAYEQHFPETIEDELIDVLSRGTGPDIFFLPHDAVLKHQSRVMILPYKSYSERDFKNRFIEEGELYLSGTGIVALPFTVDPLVMYWNRTLFSDASVTRFPTYWDEFYDLSTKLTKKDGLGITQSTAPLGEYRNVGNAKALLSALLIQAGTPIIAYREGKVTNMLSERFNLPALPADRAVSFYTDFSNPAKPAYTWNRSLPEAKTMFLAGDLAVYFGFASELADIKAKNPNLNFDVAPLPHSRAPGAPNVTYGRMTGLAVSRVSRKSVTAFTATVALTSAQSLAKLPKFTSLPPVRRDLLSARPTDANAVVFYDAALRSRGWLDPERTLTSTIFGNMIESITSGRDLVSRAVSRASGELDRLLK